MGPIQLVVFDLAGTTVDDRGMVLECFVETVQTYDLPSTAEELNDKMGLNKREVLGMLAGRLYSPGSPEAEQLADKATAKGEWPAYARASRDIYLAIQEEHDIGVRNNGSLY